MSGLTEREWALWRAMALMSRQLQAGIEHRLQEEAGISRADFEILHALDMATDQQARARDLSEMLGWEKSRISHQVTRMVARGLVARTQCATDLRGSWIELARAGRQALAIARPAYEGEVRQQFTSLFDTDEIDTLMAHALRVLEAGDQGACQAEVEGIRDVAQGAPATA